MLKTHRTTFSRRGFLKSTALVAGATLVPSIITFRANAKPRAGELQMVPGTANPQGGLDRVYLLKGDPLSGPVHTIVAEDGAPIPVGGLSEGERRVLRIFHFNDMHNHFTDMSAKKGNTHHFSQMVKLVQGKRSEARDNEVVLFLSGGDDHTGAIFDELLGWTPDEFVADTGFRINSAGGVDMGVLGNHEFDRGAELLKTGIRRDLKYPALSANIYGSAFLTRDEDYVAAAVGEAKGMRIGFLGLTTAVDTRVGQAADPELAVSSPVQAVRNVLPALAAVSDIVLILSHCGYGSGEHKSGKAATSRLIGEGDFDIADVAGPLTDKPVILIGGHSHTELNADGINPDNMREGVLITQAKCFGGYLGEIAMSIAAEHGRKGWFNSVSVHQTKPMDKRIAADDPKAAGLETEADYDVAFEEKHIAPLIKALDTKMQEVIGEVTDARDVSTEKTLADRYVGETAIANFMNDALIASSASFPGGAVDIALFNASGLQKGVAHGPLTFRGWYDVMPYADAVHVASMSGAQIRDMLDSNAKRLVRPEETGQIDLTEFVSRGFLHFSGSLRYRIALGATAAEAHAVDITLHGKPIEDQLETTFRVAFNTYIALGGFGETWNGDPIGGDVPGTIRSFDTRQLSYDHTGLVYRNEIIAHIRKVHEIGAEEDACKDGRLTVSA